MTDTAIAPATAPAPLLSVRNLTKAFPIRGGLLKRQIGSVRAVDGVSFHIEPSETFGLVGESGCGKSTTGRCVLRLIEPSSGELIFEGKDVIALSGESLRALRRDIQIIFQDPYASLNPRMTIGAIIGEALTIHGLAASRQKYEERIVHLLETVGLQADHMTRYPHEFSGGQRQRIGIARALILEPDLIICDEPVSALDLSVQAQILNLLAELKQSLNLSLLFISHDLSVVRYLSDRVLVMYLGRIVESGSHTQIWHRPLHPYTKALIDAVPDPTRRRYAAPLPGDLPDPRSVGGGCRFAPRCPIATEICRTQDPALRAAAAGHHVACHHAEPALVS